MLLKFIDRERELEGLEEAWRENGAGLFIIYGRRRIGKTELVKKFIEDKPSFYFLARRQKLSLEVERLRKEFGEAFDLYLEEAETLEEFFEEILRKLDLEEKMVFVIDEFPYWVEEVDGILSEFQHLWDEVLKKENLFVILTGSSVGMMETQVLGRKSPLYGRRTGQLNLKEMPINSLGDFLPDYSFEDLLRVYGSVGGVPFYLKEFDSKKNFLENIRSTFLNKLNILHEEAEILLREELRKPNVYFNILKTIIDGATTLSDISSKSGVDITNINKYLKVLNRLKIVEKEYPVTETPKKKNFLYKVKDNYFKFWLNFIYPNMSRIEEHPEGVLQLISDKFKNYMGPVFEDVCRQGVLKRFGYNEVGRWWFKDKEIDIVALKEDEVLFGECKWSDKKVGENVLGNLEKTSENVRLKDNGVSKKFVLFSKSGFTKSLKEIGKEREDLGLYDFKDLESLFAKAYGWEARSSRTK